MLCTRDYLKFHPCKQELNIYSVPRDLKIRGSNRGGEAVNGGRYLGDDCIYLLFTAHRLLVGDVFGIHSLTPHDKQDRISPHGVKEVD